MLLTLSTLQLLRDGQHHNSFFKLDGDEALDYDAVVEYMTTKFNVAEVERSCAEKYLKALKLKDEITPDMESKMVEFDLKSSNQ